MNLINMWFQMSHIGRVTMELLQDIFYSVISRNDDVDYSLANVIKMQLPRNSVFYPIMHSKAKGFSLTNEKVSFFIIYFKT